MKSLLLTACLCLLFALSSIAQIVNSPLYEIDESILDDFQIKSKRIIKPDNYKTLRLDAAKLEVILNSAPKEGIAGADKSEPFEVVMPGGKVEAFHLVEYSMMEPALAAQFPSIKTYHGYGVNDPSLWIRLDWTINGLNAMMQLREGLAFIKPYSRGDTEHYYSYYGHDLPLINEPFECGTVDEKSDEPESPESISAGDCQFRTYRLAVAVTGEYATTVLGASSAGNAADDAIVTAHIVTSINQISGWYERDVGARFILIANLADIFYYDGATDPYTNNNSITMLGENITNLDAVIGSANFDIGHVLGSSGGGSGGVAGLNVLCGASKARGVTRASAVGITQPRFLKVWAHELGHQFGAGHTQGENCQRSSSSAMEPGAGTTLMSYVTSNCNNQIQNIPDYYFHAISIQQMSARILSTSCAAILPSTNSAPIVSAGADVTVPSSTPLLLQATASDPDNDPLTYTWEQYNNDFAQAIPPQATNTLGPSFRSLPPSTESGRYLPNLAAVVSGTTPTWEVLPSVARTMDFRVTVRDNSTNSISCTAEDDITVTTVADGPFLVTSPTTSGVVWIEGETHNVSWDVAGTDVAPVSCVNVDILLSYDGGFTYPVTLASNVANDGSEDVVVPIGTTTTARVQVRCSNNIFYNISAEDFEIQLSTGPTFLLSIPNPLGTICPGDIESNISLTTSALAGFAGNITLSATNLPGSSSVTFASSVIAAGSGTTFEIGNTSGLAEGNYTLTIVGTSGAIVREFDYALTVEEPPGTTTLDSPADNAVDIGLLPMLSWISKPNATSYDVQVSQSPTFTGLIVNETVSTNAYSLSTGLEGLTLYFWRVRATTTCGDTPWSTSRQFITKDCDAAFIENTPVSISSSGTPEVNSILTVSGSGLVDGLVVSNVNGTHTYVSDLEVRLIAPGGSPSVLLWEGECGSSNDFILSLSDDATTPVGSAPCSPLGQGGIYIPEESLSAFDGLPIAGDWTLNIQDNFNQDGGQLTSWTLEFCSLGALPVDLLSFDVSGQKTAIQLEWETANEYNNAGFEIERRTEAEREFTSIGAMLATDDAQQINYYDYLDKDVRPGVRYYYRLRQNDFDGQYEYSPIRTAMLEARQSGLQVYPNPVRGELFGLLNVAPDIETELQLHDLNGRVVREQVVSGNQFTMNLGELPTGLYVLKALYPEGEEITKIVVR